MSAPTLSSRTAPADVPSTAPAPASTPRSPGQIRCAWRPQAGATVVRLDGDLDAARAPKFEELLASRLAAALHIVALDLSQLTFLGVAGVAVLARAALRADTEHVQLRLVTGPHCVDRALYAGGLHTRLACYPTVEAALDG